MKNFFIMFLVIFIGFETKSNEPFVILEYNNQNFNESDAKILIKTTSSLKITIIRLTTK